MEVDFSSYVLDTCSNMRILWMEMYVTQFVRSFLPPRRLVSSILYHIMKMHLPFAFVYTVFSPQLLFYLFSISPKHGNCRQFYVELHNYAHLAFWWEMYIYIKWKTCSSLCFPKSLLESSNGTIQCCHAVVINAHQQVLQQESCLDHKN